MRKTVNLLAECQRMRLKALEEKYFVDAGVEETSLRVQKALDEVGLKNVPPRYLLVEYSPGWVGKALEIEFLFKEITGGTEVAVKWPYTKELPSKDETPTAFRKYQEETRKIIESLIGEFKRKIGAKENTATAEKNHA
jgi:hypothetical protein